MRSLLTVGLSIALCASAGAQTGNHAKASAAHHHMRQPVIVPPGQGTARPARFSVPGWSDEQTQRWLDNATSCEGCG
jgi:hypothetical protein